MSWKKLSSRTVFENPWMTVYEDHVINPGGGENQYGYVHFKNRAVAVVPVDNEAHTWLVGQDRYTLGEYSWEVPMGGSPPDEDLLTTAHRELKEETGLVAATMTEIMKVHPSNSITDEVGYIYLARDLEEGEPDPEEMEVLTVRRLPFADVLDMVWSGEITDGISCLALMRVARLLDK